MRPGLADCLLTTHGGFLVRAVGAVVEAVTDQVVLDTDTGRAARELILVAFHCMAK